MTEPASASERSAAGSIGPVLIRLPPDPSLSRVLRLAAGGIAAMGAFNVEETEDIKIAVSEVLLALIEHGCGQPIDIEFYRWDDAVGLVTRSARFELAGVVGREVILRDGRVLDAVMATIACCRAGRV